MPKILLVEDQTVFRENLAEALEDHAYKVIQASDASEAMAAVATSNVDLFLLDMALPGTSGPDLLRTFRRIPGLCRVPAIFLTAFPRLESLEQASQLGVGDFLVKSDISLMDLLGRIEREIVDPTSSSSSSASFEELEPVVARRHLRSSLRRWRPVPDRAQAREIFQLASRPGAIDDLQGHLATDPDAVRWLREVGYSTRPPQDVLRLLLVRSVVDATMRSVQPSTDIRRLWRSGLATGLLAQAFFREGGFSSPLEAFLAGLCSQVPWIFCLQALENDYCEVRAEAWEQGRPISEELAGVFGADERTLSFEVLRGMDLPDAVWTSVLDLHRGSILSSWEPGPGGRLLSVVQQMAHRIEPIWHPCVEVGGIRSEDAPWLAFADPGVFQQVLGTFSELAGSKVFSEAAVCDPVFARASLENAPGLLYLREAEAARPDPLELALRWVGTLEVVDSLDAFSVREGVVRVAWAEPDSPRWKALLEIPRRVVLLHHKPLSAHAPLGAHAEIQLPAPFCLLQHALRQRR
jgi:CheY-like chemotaxis protein